MCYLAGSLLLLFQAAGPSPLVTLERQLDRHISNLKAARYVANRAYTEAVVVAWTERESVSSVSLLCVRIDSGVMVIRISQDDIAANEKLDLNAISRPLPTDPLLDEPVDSEVGRLLSSLLDALQDFDLSSRSTLRLVGQTADWKALLGGSDNEGLISYHRNELRHTYFCGNDCIPALLDAIKMEDVPSEPSMIVAGERGQLIAMSHTGTIRLYLNDPWKGLSGTLPLNMAGVIEFNRAQLIVGPSSLLSNLLSPLPTSDDLVQELVIRPRGVDIIYDPLIWVMGSN